MFKNIQKIITAVLYAVLGTTVCGLLLLFLVAALPQDILRENVKTAVAQGQLAENYPTVLWFRSIDMYTECVGLGVALNLVPTLESVLSMRGARECQGLKTWVEQDFLPPPEGAYARYWHGYQIILKPLYTFIKNIHLVRFICALTALVLFAALWFAAVRRVGTGCAAAIVFSFILPGALTVFPLATHGVQFWLVLAGGIACFVRRNESPPVALFAVLGSVSTLVSFFNMESLSLGLPLLCHCCLRWKSGITPFNILKESLILSVAWGSAFLALWGIKWGMAYVVLPQGDGFFGNTLAVYPARSLDMILHAFSANLLRMPWTVSAAVLLALAWRLRRKGLRIATGVSALLPAMIVPFIWLCLMPGHAEKHSMFMPVILWPFMGGLCIMLLGESEAPC